MSAFHQTEGEISFLTEWTQRWLMWAMTCQLCLLTTNGE